MMPSDPIERDLRTWFLDHGAEYPRPDLDRPSWIACTGHRSEGVYPCPLGDPCPRA